MDSILRRLTAVSAAGATALVGTVAFTVAPAQAATTITDYGLTGRAFGTVARVDATGAASDRSAPSYLGCTRRTGISKKNFAAETGEPISPALYVGAITNTNQTYRKAGRVGVRSTSKVADLRLGAPDGPHIRVEGLATVADAWATKAGKFQGKASYDSIKISAALFPEEAAPLQDLLNEVGAGINDLLQEIRKAPGDVLVIPGLGELTLGNRVVNINPRVVKANAVALRVTLYGPDGTMDKPESGDTELDDVEVKVGRSRAFVYRDVPSGIMGGKAAPLNSRVLGDGISVGRLNERPLPCNGTNGKIKEVSTAGLNAFNADQLEVKGLNARVFGIQRSGGRARAWTESKIARVVLGGADGLVAEAIVGRVNVRQNRAGKAFKNIRGSKIGSLSVGGEEQALEPGQVESFEIPGGVVKVESFLREGGKRGMKVTALRLTFLADTGAETVINLGMARTYIRKN